MPAGLFAQSTLPGISFGWRFFGRKSCLHPCRGALRGGTKPVVSLTLDHRLQAWMPPASHADALIGFLKPPSASLTAPTPANGLPAAAARSRLNPEGGWSVVHRAPHGGTDGDSPASGAARHPAGGSPKSQNALYLFGTPEPCLERPFSSPQKNAGQRCPAFSI